MARRGLPLHRVYDGALFIGLARAVHGAAAICILEKKRGRHFDKGWADIVPEEPIQPAIIAPKRTPLPAKRQEQSDLSRHLPPARATCPDCGYADPQRWQTEQCPSCGTSR